MKDFCDKSKINNGVAFGLFIVADILKFEIAMGITEFMDDFQLGDNLHSNFGNTFEVKAFVFVGVIKTLLNFENFEDISSSV